jgi:hypothetical protein
VLVRRGRVNREGEGKEGEYGRCSFAFAYENRKMKPLEIVLS